MARRGSFKFLKSREAVWVSLILAVVVLLGYAAVGDTEAIAMFALAGLITSVCTDNMVIVFGAAIVGGGLGSLASARVEAFVEGIDSSKSEKNGEKKGAKKKDAQKDGKDVAPGTDGAHDSDKSNEHSSAKDSKSTKEKESLVHTSLEGLKNIESLIGRVEGLMDRFHKRK